MKKTNPISAVMLCSIHIQLILLLTSCSNFDIDNHADQPPLQAIASDTIVTSTGDAHLDSLLQIASVTPQNATLAQLYFDIAMLYEDFDFETAKDYLLRLEYLSDQLDWNEGHYLYAEGMGMILVREQLADSALIIFNEALDLAKSEDNEFRIANMYLNIGNVNLSKQWYQTALSFYLEALQIYERINEIKKLQALYFMMAQLYKLIDASEKAIECCEKSLALNSEDEYTHYVLAGIYTSIHQHEKANRYNEEALRIATSNNNLYVMEGIYLIKANNALSLFELDTAEKHAQLSLEINSQFGRAGCCQNYITLSKIEIAKGNYDKSEDYIREAFDIAVEFGGLQEKRLCYMIMSALAVAQHKYKEYLQYGDEITMIEIEIAKETSVRAAEEMAAKYETEKKELKIFALEKEKQLIIVISIAGGAVLLLALAVFLFLWLWTIQKRRLAESHIKQLEQEKKLIATQAVFDGEVQERTRLARDLHDGLGGKLTSMKINLQELKQTAGLSSDAIEEQFKIVMNVLDDSVKEMRRVSHNLMPETLSRSGLKTAISDFCRSMSSIIVFNYFGDEARLDMKLEALIYRSIHELVNNAMKYAGASQIIVQILREHDSLSFIVQDNGCGFDTAAETDGIGLQGIRARVESFGGDIHIDSKIGEGTEIIVEMKIDYKSDL